MLGASKFWKLVIDLGGMISCFYTFLYRERAVGRPACLEMSLEAAGA